jgi:predicted nucleic acid-binding protein
MRAIDTNVLIRVLARDDVTQVVEIARAAGHPPVGTFDRALARVDGAVAI